MDSSSQSEPFKQSHSLAVLLHGAKVAADSGVVADDLVASEEDRLLPGSGVFLTIHPPVGGTAGSHHVVVLVPPLFEEMPRTRKVMVNLARSLAAAGCVAVRFDYRGTGFSRGRFEEVSLSSMRRDLSAVADLCASRGFASMRLLGFRLGGYLAAERAQSTSVAKVVAWEPVLDPGAFMRHMLRIEVANQMVSVGHIRFDQASLIARFGAGEKVLVDGYRTSADLHRELTQAPVFTLSSLAPARAKLRLFYWRTPKAHDEAHSLGLASDLISDVRFSWSDIRFLQPRHDELFAKTMAALREGGTT